MHVEPTRGTRVLDVIAWMEGKNAGVRPVPEPEEELLRYRSLPARRTGAAGRATATKGAPTGRCTRPYRAFHRLRLQGFVNAVALDTWQSYEITKRGARLRVTSAPGRHAQGPLQAALPQVMGSVLEFSAPGEPDLSVYVTGDTLLIEDLRELPRRHPHLDLGLWHLGGTRIPFVRGMLVTMDASMGADLLEIVHPDRTVPIHNDDYGVFTSPRGAFLAEVDRRGLTGVRAVDRGETVPLPLP